MHRLLFALLALFIGAAGTVVIATSSVAAASGSSHTAERNAIHMQLKNSSGQVVCFVYGTPENTRPTATGCPNGTFTEQLFNRDWSQNGSNRTVTVWSGGTAPAPAPAPEPEPNPADGSHTGARNAIHMQLKNSSGQVVCFVYGTAENARPVATGCPSGTWTEQLFNRDWSQNGSNRTVTVSSGGTAPAPSPAPAPVPSPSPSPAPIGLVFGQDSTPESSSWQRPARFVETQDPAYGTTVERLTNADAGPWDRNDYSRRQAENSNGTLFMTHVRTQGNSEFYRIYNIDGQLVNELDIHPDGQPQWHPTNPNVIRHVDGPNRSVGSLVLTEVDARTDAVIRTYDISNQVTNVWSDAHFMRDGEEGSPSEDGNQYAWAVYNFDEDLLGIVSYNLQTGAFSHVNARTNVGRLDYVTTSPNGRHVVASYVNATYVYNTSLNQERLIFAGTEHSDVAKLTETVDAFVYVDFGAPLTRGGAASPDSGWVVSVNLDTMERTRMFNIYRGDNGRRTLTSLHISGKGYDRPGWVVVSSYNCRDAGGYACDKVFAAEMATNGQILNLAHAYLCEESGVAAQSSNQYFTEPHAVVSRDWNHVYFNSNSNNCGRIAEVYRIDVPNF